jgi:predicted Zn-dependent protease
MADGGANKQSLFMVLNGLKDGDVIEPGQRLKLISN